ncbi:hypothetical protein Moror_13550 [Moniliophthora roreri MCA 2997]|uniref:F-box domain-containing protein n=2 Tax=Moniliophthora roreri TaxID=221103 RepID=V2WUB8_MONRO|nr:hypothetical protein Moror_13550 [Moniliophthora roreri MCA 2997]KAI3604250.1 hypothetical protein WG66_010073 [Moniliophthora roreri]
MENGDAKSTVPESPFANKHGTNYAPSPKEILQIRDILAESDTELQIIEEEIARLHDHRVKLKSFIDKHHSLLSPIRRVPADILREIFIRCIPEDYIPTSDLQEAPLLLTGICQLWREIVISTPQLWNRIHIFLSSPLHPPVTDYFRKLIDERAKGICLWLNRSGMMHLALSFQVVSPERHATTGGEWTRSGSSLDELRQLHIEFISMLLSRYASRCSSLTLDVVPDYVRGVFQGFGAREFKVLEEFRSFGALLRRPITQANDHVQLPDAIFSLPTLRVLHFDEGFPKHNHVCWENLTELNLGIPSSYAFSSQGRIDSIQAVQTLSRTHSLRHCTLGITVDLNADTSSAPEGPILLPYLHILNLNFYCKPSIALMGTSATATPGPQIGNILSVVEAPMLEHLAIILEGRRDSSYDPNQNPLTLLVERSGCRLLSFSTNLPMTTNTMIDFLRASPSLLRLKLGGELSYCMRTMEFPHPFADFLRILTSPDDMCPILEDLVFVGCMTGHEESLITLAEARMKTLKCMKVAFFSFIEDPKISLKLQALREEGMFVSWVSPRDERRDEIKPFTRVSRRLGVDERLLGQTLHHY